MITLLKNINFPSLFDVATISGTPVLPETINPIVLTTAILMAIALMLPCLIWFLKNFMRIILKKNYEFFNRSIKWILAFSLLLFILSVILMVLAIQEVI